MSEPLLSERLAEIRELAEAKRLRGNVPVSWAVLRDLLDEIDRREVLSDGDAEALRRFREAGWEIADDGDPYRPDEVPT